MDPIEVESMHTIPPDLPQPKWLIGDVAIYERGDEALLILLSRRQCSHHDEDFNRMRHVQYYVTYRRESAKEYERLIEWLDFGFWWDSFCDTPKPVIEQFLTGGCMGNAHFL
jgi:hypothetical protein